VCPWKTIRDALRLFLFKIDITKSAIGREREVV